MAKIAEFTLTKHLTVHGFSQHSKRNVTLNNNGGGSVLGVFFFFLGSEIWGTVTREKRRIYRKTDRERQAWYELLVLEERGSFERAFAI